MKLIRAQIDGFGRYIDRTFEFSEGLNVLYGKNEAGKSTLQHFLLAMLYGLKKPGRKRAVYMEEEQKYRPWRGDRFGGVLWFEADGVTYRVERNLRKEDESTRLFRQDTGEEVTGRFPVDSRKEITFAETLWNADRDLFQNTLCIGPVDERERANWLRASVRHGDGGGGEGGPGLATPEQVNIRAAEDAIHKRLDAIGSERAPTKPFGQAQKRRDDLQKAYLEALSREDSQKKARLLAEAATRTLQEAERAEAAARKHLNHRLAVYLRLQDAKKGEIHGRLQQLEEALAENRLSFAFDEQVYRDVQQDFQRLLTAKREAESYRQRYDALQSEAEEAIRLAGNYPSVTEHSLTALEQTAHALEQAESRLSALPEEHGDETLAALHRKQRSGRLQTWIFGLLAVAAVPFCFSQWWAILVAVACAGLGLYSYLTAHKAGAQAAALEEENAQTRNIQETTRSEQTLFEKNLLQLLGELEVDTPRQYRQKWAALMKAREQAAHLEKQTGWLLGEANRAKGERDILARRLLRQLGGEEAQAAAWSTEDLRLEVERLGQKYETARELQEQKGVWERERLRLQHELQTIDTHSSRWQETARELGVEAEPPSLLAESDVTPDELEEALASWRQSERHLFKVQTDAGEANARYETLTEGHQAAADLLLEKELADAEYLELHDEREALLLAQELWGEVKEEMYQAVAPRFAASLTEVTEKVTEGRYRDVYLDRDEQITALSPDTGRTVDLTSLSQGTVDQITFALGLALSGWTIPGGEGLPLLLDEPFRRYDDDRLQAVAGVLLEEAEQRQVFLFTCREQEVELLRGLGGRRVRMVELSEPMYGMINMESKTS